MIICLSLGTRPASWGLLANDETVLLKQWQACRCFALKNLSAKNAALCLERLRHLALWTEINIFFLLGWRIFKWFLRRYYPFGIVLYADDQFIFKLIQKNKMKWFDIRVVIFSTIFHQGAILERRKKKLLPSLKCLSFPPVQTNYCISLKHGPACFCLFLFCVPLFGHFDWLACFR